MIQVLYGKRGSGKSKKLIDMANAAVGNIRGDMVFIDDNKRCILSLNRRIRFVDTTEYDVGDTGKFTGFIYGILSQNFDVELVYIDGLPRLAGKQQPEQLERLFGELSKISAKHAVSFVLSVSGEESSVPAFVQPYRIQTA